MAKQDLLTELAAHGINQSAGTESIMPLTGKETVAELEAILEKAKAERTAPPPGAPQKPSTAADFSWAHNASKLMRAKAYVNEQTPGLKGKEFETAVKERYLELKGLLSSEAPSRGGKPAGRVQNVADNDEDK